MKNENQFSRTGTVIPNERVRKSHELLQYAMDKMNERNLTCLFDMTHNNGGEYALHEFCGALGGISIRYLDLKVYYKCIRAAITDQDNCYNYSQQLVDSANVDKYSLRTAWTHYDDVVFLPGSNIMHSTVNFDRVDRAVEHGAIIKPHPVTNASDMYWLRERYDPDCVLSAKLSGGELLQNCKRAYMAKNSELWFLAIAYSKGMRNIGVTHHTEVYRPVIDTIINHPQYDPKVGLNRVFSSKYSGIYFSKEQIDNNLDFYLDFSQEAIGDNVHKSNKS